jgi:predicted CXXCH cytochrome family protein
MQEATETTVLGSFTGGLATDASGTVAFFRRDRRFVVNAAGPDAQRADFEAKYTFGVFPLQQYLLPLHGGRLQAFGIAWDARPAAAGGQRWFSLYPDQPLRSGDPLHWTGIDQTWNYQCADCHSTGLRKNYDEKTDSYATTWSEISVGCEACHGPASNHLAWARQEQGWRALESTHGLVQRLDERRGVGWSLGGAPTATRSVPRTTSREIDTCARCHSRRSQYTDAIHAGADWLDGFRPALLEPGLYFPDGQQREEVYTWGSFLQSRMYAAGVTCSDCHEPHSGKLRAAGNSVCAQCHAPAVFEAASHHHHPAGSPGAQCVACHMPATTYMVIDARRDHSIRIPRPDRSVTLGVPNACGPCHAERGAQWAAEAVAGWYPQRKPGFQGFAETFAAAERGDPAAAQALAKLLGNDAEAALVRASAAARLAAFLSPNTLPAVSGSLRDPHALVRAAAAETLAVADPGTRANELAPLLADPVCLVRMAAARSLAGDPEARLLADERGAFTKALDEWLAAQRFNADRPEAQTSLGALYAERGGWAEAIAAYRRALALDPTYVQAAVNLADVYRSRNDEREAEQVLRQALARNPDAAPLHHVLGLALIRSGRTAEAIASLQRSTLLDPDDPRFAYVYAVALHDTGDAKGSIAVLRRAVERHPFDGDLRAALSAYERK